MARSSLSRGGVGASRRAVASAARARPRGSPDGATSMTSESSAVGRGLVVAWLLAVCSGLACGTAVREAPPLVRPGAPGQPSRPVSATDAVALGEIRPTAADVRFMQGMIVHHAQALEMAALVDDRTRNEQIRQLARRILLSQADEIQMMEEWLRSRGAPVPDRHAHHADGGPLMPGMLTPDELAHLAATEGARFDRLFLEFMIRHHEGALVMVAELLAEPGAAQDSDIFTFASEVEADQRMEIVRMAALLKELQP